MIISIIAIVKWLLFALSGGALYRGFSHDGDSDALPAKVAEGVTALLTMVAFVSDASGIFASDEISKSEQLFWESVEKHPSEKLYRGYLEKYPDGQFKDIALTQAANYGKESSVATIEQPAPAVLETEIPPVLAMVENSVATGTVETPATPEKVEQPVTAPVELAQAVPTVEPVDEWKTIDHYQVKGGLVKDSKTGLMWMRCSMGQSWDGSMCQGSPKQYYWDDIKKTANFNYENYSDWRVPTLKELQTLIYCSSGKPKIWDDIHNQCEGDYAKPTIMSDVFPQTPSSWEFMSSSLVKFYWGNTPAIVNFINRQSHAIEDANHPIPHVVRLVRSEKNTPIAEMQQTTPPRV